MNAMPQHNEKDELVKKDKAKIIPNMLHTKKQENQKKMFWINHIVFFYSPRSSFLP